MRLSDILKNIQNTKQPQQEKKEIPEKKADKKDTFEISHSVLYEEKGSSTKFVDVDKIYSDTIKILRQIHKELWLGDSVSLSDSLVNLAKNIVGGTKIDIDNFLVYSCYTTPDNFIYSSSANISIYSAILSNVKNFSEKSLTILMLSALLHKVAVYSLDNKIEANSIKTKIEKIKIPYDIQVNVANIINLFYKKNTTEQALPEDEKLIIQILQISDSYEEMTHIRPNKERIIPYDAISVLIKQASQQILDQSLVKLFVDIISIFPVGSYVKLTTGEIGKVVGVNRSMPLRPKIKIVLTQEGTAPKEEVYINLAENTKIHIVEPIDETKLKVDDKKFLLQVRAQKWWVRDNI